MGPIKRIPAVRVIAKPIIDWKRKKDHERYLRSPDHFYLQTLKGIHEDKRCFIIGNGPSLRVEDLDMLKGEYTFAANRIFTIFDKTDWRPTYYLSIDDKVLKDFQNDFLRLDLGHMFINHKCCPIEAPTNRLTKIFHSALTMIVDQYQNDCASMYISEDVSSHFCDGQTVTFDSIQLAIYMGFKEIYLIGVDHNYSKVLDAAGKVHIDPTVQDYFDNRQYEHTYPANLKASQYAYTIAREYCDTHGITIRNATRGGKLELFKRVNFDELIRQKKSEDKLMRIIGVIPARYQSSRLPGKPLTEICGKPMIWWVYSRVKGAGMLDDILVATDDKRIEDVCEQYNIPSIMTSNEHDTPTSRVYEVSTKVDADLYLTLMGDEPLIDQRCLELIIPKSSVSEYYVAALTNILDDPTEVIDCSNQKVVTNSSRDILMISRSPIPYPKGTLDFKYEKITGVQLFSKEALKFYNMAKKSDLERAEENDLMRFIENGIPVKAFISPYKTVSVDTEKDLEVVRAILGEDIRNESES